jgi:carbamoyltransferase
LGLNRSLFMATPIGKKLSALIEQHTDRNVAAAAQLVLEEMILEYVNYLGQRTGQSKIALAGGVFLNVKMNKRILLELPFVEDVYIHPHAGDGGTCIGAALELYYQKTQDWKPQRMRTAALGVEYSPEEIEEALAQFSEEVEYERVEDIARVTAEQIAQGKVIGWFQGRAEWGPRALGSRTVAADPRNPKTKERINDQMKRRDWFMPFAPSILADKAGEYFVGCKESPFMILAFDVAPGKVNDIRAAIHIDETARPQTVERNVAPLYYDMIHSFYELTGVPAILNTSFNRHGLPIVETPRDAIEHLTWECVDELAIGPFIARRRTGGTR